MGVWTGASPRGPRGEGNGQPRAYVPIGGQRGEGGASPLSSSPGGTGTWSQVRWGRRGGRGEGGPGAERGPRGAAAPAAVAPRRRLPVPGDSEGASLRSLCVRGGGLAAVTWRAAGSASTLGGMCVLVHEDAACGACCAHPRGPSRVLAVCVPRGGEGRGPGRGVAAGGGPRERGPGPQPQGLGFLRVACSVATVLPSPCLEQSPPCALRGRERKGGKSYFSKLLSSSRRLPCDSCGGREAWEGLGRRDFPECGAGAGSAGCPVSARRPAVSQLPRLPLAPTPAGARSWPAKPGRGSPGWGPGR